MPIRVLPPEVATRIAAGEVIERPASVVKELFENAIDAGATGISVEIAQGGRRSIRVADDGCGIPAAEVELAFYRHATSKLTSAEDLYRIRTLGFRGEALASIAAVSRVTLTTRAASEEVGMLLRLEGGATVQRAPIARPPGTTLLVENLFYNTPARLKFLRADPTEAGHIARLVSAYALVYPEKRLALTNNGRDVLRTLGTGALEDVVLTLFGLDVLEQMLPVAAESAEGEGPVTTVNGLISAPDLHRANRRDILLFVNRRWVQDASLTFAIGEAYRTLLPAGRHPLVVLNIALPPEEVDVNIHPTKQEVRFRRQRDVFAAVQRAVRATLLRQRDYAGAPAPGLVAAPWRDNASLRGNAASWQGAAWRDAARGASPGLQSALDMASGDAGDLRRGDLRRLGSMPATEDVAGGRVPMLRVVGQIAQTYIIAEGPGGMYLIDQHAAHERIRYDQLRAQRAGGAVPSQELLQALAVDVSPAQAALLEGHLEDLAAFGFDIAPFGGGSGTATFLVRRAPASLEPDDIPAALSEMLDAALDGGEGFSWEDQALFTVACHSAVRAGKVLSHDEMRDLVRQLERTAIPHTCPHGRPTMIHLSQAQLDHQFGRH